jgi:putative PIG3 family NAD(P)H quinone oxidoreductase
VGIGPLVEVAAMRAIVPAGTGGPEVLKVGEAPDPELREGDVLVAVRAAGVNRADLVQRLGRYPPPPGESPILGLEVAGEVMEISPSAAGKGPGGRTWGRGDRVMALLAGGGYAERARVPAAQAMPIPERLSFAEAAVIPEAFLTSWLNLFLLGRLEKGEVAVVHAAASGVGTAALQLCRGVAGVVLATASKAKLDACASLGATHLLDRAEVPQALPLAVRSAAGRGADVILDLVGAGYFEANLTSLALQGRLLCVSTLSGSKATIDLGAMLTKRLTVMGSTLRNRSAEQKAKLVASFTEKALPRFATGELRPVLARTFPLEDARAAHELLERNELVGKIALTL